MDWKSPVGEELDFIIVHLAVDQFLAALEAVYPGNADEVEVVDFLGRDEALAYLCFACAEMLSMRVPGKSERVTALMHLFAAYLVEKYTDAASEKPKYRGGLPIGKVEDYVRERLGKLPCLRIMRLIFKLDQPLLVTVVTLFTTELQFRERKTFIR